MGMMTAPLNTFPPTPGTPQISLFRPRMSVAAYGGRHFDGAMGAMPPEFDGSSRF